MTAISCDQHKYGLAPKGVSVIMFKTKLMRQCCYTLVSDWPGGMYATTSACGSKAGAPVSGAWYSMMFHGRDGFVTKALIITNALNEIVKAFRESPELSELEVIGDPKTVVVAFKYKKQFPKNIYYMQGAMSKKGWHISGIQSPPALHISVTHGIAAKV